MLATIILSVIVLMIVGLIIWKMVKDKRSGVSSCGGKCSQCAGGCAVHGSNNRAL